ncbi:MAG: EamA family transporter [Lachnospiraceae bacterium]
MDKELLCYAAIFLLGVFLSAVSQVMLKKSAQKSYSSKMREYLNPLVIIAYAIFFSTTLLTVLAYKKVPLSMGPILESTSYIYVTIFGAILFHEKINIRKVAGLLLIILGITVYAIS